LRLASLELKPDRFSKPVRFVPGSIAPDFWIREEEYEKTTVCSNNKNRDPIQHQSMKIYFSEYR
jgi:hypothetical protein